MLLSAFLQRGAPALLGAAIAIGSLGTVRAEDDGLRSFAQSGGEHQTIYELWTAGGIADALEVTQDGEAIVVGREGGSWTGRLILPDDLGPAGERRVAVTITIEEDGGGWPDRLVGAGILYGFTDTDAEFLFAVLSPQDGGRILIGQNVVGGGVGIAQTLGNENTAAGEPVRLELTETNGGVQISAGGSSTSFSSSAISELQANPDARIGMMIFGTGSYRFEDLVIE